jgi:hypothetical protein
MRGVPWHRWDPQTFAEFDARANCLSKEYSEFGPDNPVYGGRHVDGDATLGENIADEVATVCVWAFSLCVLHSLQTCICESFECSAESPAAVGDSNMCLVRMCTHAAKTNLRNRYMLTYLCAGGDEICFLRISTVKKGRGRGATFTSRLSSVLHCVCSKLVRSNSACIHVAYVCIRMYGCCYSSAACHRGKQL